MSKILLHNGFVLHSEGKYRADLLVEDGLIKEIAPIISKNSHKDADAIDIAGSTVYPAFVDLHSHLRQGDRTKPESETIESGTKSGVAGGYGAVVAMANNQPATDNAEKVLALREIAEESAHCYVEFASAITQERAGEKLVDFEALANIGVSYFSDDGDCVENTELVFNAMSKLQKINGVFAQHCESKNLSRGHINEGEMSNLYKIEGRNHLAETSILARDIEIAKSTGCNYHALHASVNRSVELVAAANSNKITIEVCPHHLVFNEEDLQNAKNNEYLSPFFKMNPPLRTHHQNILLQDALQKGLIDAVATDHAPHSDKTSNTASAESFCCAPAGITGIQNAHHITSKILKNPYDLARVMSINPARISGLNKYDFGLYPKEQNRAHLCVISDQEYELENYSNSVNSPYGNKSFVELTIVDGKIKYRKSV